MLRGEAGQYPEQVGLELAFSLPCTRLGVGLGRSSPGGVFSPGEGLAATEVPMKPWPPVGGDGATRGVGVGDTRVTVSGRGG